MAQHNFKVGDRVRFVKGGLIGWEDEEWSKEDGLKIGEEYIVQYAGMNKWHQPYIMVENKILGHHPDHFKPVKKSWFRRIFS